MRDPIDRRADGPPQTWGEGQTKQGDIKSVRAEVIATADDAINMAEPSSPTHPQYPNNAVEHTLSGHLRELDDTPGAERILEMHKSGTFYEIHANGTKVTKVFSDEFCIDLENRTVVVGGNWNVTVQGNANILVAGNCKQKIGGDYDLTVAGNMTTRVAGNTTHYSKNAISIQSNTSVTLRSQTTMALQSVGNMTLRSSSIFQAWADGQAYIDGSRLDFNLPGPNPAKIVNSDPGGGLTVPTSIVEPSFQTMKIISTDNNALMPVAATNVTYPKDRTTST